MWQFRLVCALVACGLWLSPPRDVHAQEKGKKDYTNKDKERKATNTEEPDVVEISEEGFACNEDVISIGGIKAAGWYKIDEKTNRIEVKKGTDSPLLKIRGKTIRWWCAAAFEDWQADTGAEFIVVSRGPKGAGKVIYYKKK